MGKIIKTQNVKEGRSATPPTPPVYNDSIFSTWDTNEYKNVTRNLNVNAIYALKVFYVTFTVEGVYYNTQSGVVYGTAALPPYVPPREGYDFVWDDCSNITADTTINGKYVKSKTVFEVKFIKSFEGQEKIIKSEYVKKGDSATPPSLEEINSSDPAVETDVWCLYSWDKDYSVIVQDTETRTVYKERDNTLLLRCAVTNKAKNGRYTDEYKFNYENKMKTLQLAEKKTINRKYVAPFDSIGDSGSQTMCTVQVIDNSRNIEEIGKYCFQGSSPTAYVNYVSFPSVQKLNEGAFYQNQYIANADMPNLESIGKSAFYYGKNLESAVFPKCTKIEEQAFYDCKKLNNVDFTKVQEIGDLAFSKCNSIQSLELPSLTSIGENAFKDMDSLSSFTANNLSTINSKNIVTAQNLENFSISSVQTICQDAFSTNSYFRKVRELRLPKVESIGRRALVQFCYVTHIVLNNQCKDSLMESMNSSGMWGIGTQRKNIWYNRMNKEIGISWE